MRSSSLLLATAALGGATLGAAPYSAGDRARAVLEWTRGQGAEGCTDGSSLERAVEARLRRDAFTAQGPADLVVRGNASRSDAGYVVRLQLLRANGEEIGARELTTGAAHCSALDDSLALVVALMVDVPRDSVAPAAAPAAPAPRPSRITLPQRTHAPRQPWHGSLALLGVAEWGFLPGVAPGLRARAGVEPPYFWWTEVDATLFSQTEVSSDGGGARFSLASVGLYLCPLGWASASLRAAACLGQSVGRLRAEGFGFDVNRSQTRLVYDIGARGSVWWRLFRPLAWVAGVGVEYPLVRDSFVLSRRPGGPEELHRPSMAFTAETGLGLEFP